MLRLQLRTGVSAIFFSSLLLFLPVTVTAQDFHSAWPKDIERVWAGPQYWANRLQDWRISNGRLECITSDADRNIHLLTHQLIKQKGSFEMSVRLGRINKDQKTDNCWVGFRIGAKGRFDDYRESAIYGKGINAGITADSKLFINDTVLDADVPSLDDIELRLSTRMNGDMYKLILTASDPKTGKKYDILTTDKIHVSELIGNLALVCENGRFWFSDWKVSGSKIQVNKDQTFGPILFAQHTLSRGVLKMTAQMAPVGKADSQSVRLQVKEKDSSDWKTVAEEKIDKLARTATFRIENWDSSRDIPYRLAYALIEPDGKPKDYYWLGTIRRQPLDKETIVVAGFTGNNDTGFPNADVVKHVKTHNPDVLVFTGDQIYERVAGYGVQRSPLDAACLDYLRKWYIWGWSYADLMRDRPCICLPDDHDVYHGNLWGAGGRPADGQGQKGQDSGGYTMPAEWVKMVERTQTSHLPDPYDPTPVEQGIGVYYCPMNYGGISFAIIEDRKFKSSPTAMLPQANVVNGWAKNPDFNAQKDADVSGAVLLGDRQLKFLREWAEDYSCGAWMKVVLSQTLFANVATLPGRAFGDDIVPTLRITAPGEYPEGDMRVADMDSDGWPQTGRDKAVREMRRAFAFHICGDQHLGSTVQYGIDEWNDAGFAFCVPAVSNIWPRRWFPSEPGKNRKPASPKYTGDFKDGFGNFITVHAVSNPVVSGQKPADLHDRATGYGIAKFNKSNRTITIECWPRYSDPTDPKTGGQYPGWPITINQQDNYSRKPVAYLPTIKVIGMKDPVVQVIDESDGQIVYTLRIESAAYRPKVFEAGTYTVKVSEPDTAQMKILHSVQSIDPQETKTIEVDF